MHPGYWAGLASNYIDPDHLVLRDLVAALRLRHVLHIHLPATELMERLARISAASPTGARHVVEAVERLIGETAVAAMRQPCPSPPDGWTRPRRKRASQPSSSRDPPTGPHT